LLVEPLVVEVTRGDVVEARHRVHAVAVHDGAVELAAGDVDRMTYLRSAAKPVQALPVVRACPTLDDEQVALCCASHLARPEQLDAVRRTLLLAGASEDELECGPDPTPLHHNCSGKHAGFLALCAARGWPRPGYRLADHPCQRAMLAEVAAAAGVPAERLVTAVDGCGVVTFAVPLRRAAGMLTRVRATDGGERVVRAMRLHPDLLRGPVATDAVAIRTLDGWIAKGGAEGLLCASAPDGLGLAIKVEDGAFRAVGPALDLVLRLLGRAADGMVDPIVRNSRGERVGRIWAREVTA
jgi:L-asparaginase II